ncbi:hypothetical protein [Yoonia sp. MH D7]
MIFAKTLYLKVNMNMKFSLKTLLLFGFVASLSACEMPAQEESQSAAAEAAAGAVCANC